MVRPNGRAPSSGWRDATGWSSCLPTGAPEPAGRRSPPGRGSSERARWGAWVWVPLEADDCTQIEYADFFVPGVTPRPRGGAAIARWGFKRRLLMARTVAQATGLSRGHIIVLRLSTANPSRQVHRRDSAGPCAGAMRRTLPFRVRAKDFFAANGPGASPLSASIGAAGRSLPFRPSPPMVTASFDSILKRKE